MRALSLGLSGLLALNGCTSTDQLSGAAMRSQLRPEQQRRIVLRSTDGGAVRIDPRTELQLFLRTGEVTDWISAEALWSSDLGLSYELGGETVFIPWSDVASATARNLSGVKTAVLIVAIAGVVALIVAAVASKGGGGGSPGGSITTGSGKGASPAPVPRLAHGRIHHRAPHVHVGYLLLPTAEAMAEPAGYPGWGPERIPPPPPPGPPAGAHPAATPFDDPLAASPAPPPSVTRQARPLFDARTRRRATIRLTGAAEAGLDLTRSGQGMTAAFVGMRLAESVELAGGFRYFSTKQGPSERTIASYVGVGRLAAHLALDASKWVALPLGIEAGAGSNTDFHMRLQWGVRVNLRDTLSVGLFPFNASFAYFKEDSPMARAKVWSFPSTVELGFSY